MNRGGPFRAGLLLALAWGVLLCSCGPKPQTRILDDPDMAVAAWSRYQTTFFQTCPARDFSLRASVNVASPERHSRFLLSMWGRTTFPIRLDIQAGVGAMLAHWREDESGWIGYAPSAREAYLADSVREGAQVAGLFMPLRLDSLAQILLGCWESISGPEYDRVELLGNNFAFETTRDSVPLTLVLAPDGRPVSASRGNGDLWTVGIDQWDNAAVPTPRRISLTQGEQSAVIRIQRLDTDIAPWKAEELRLDLPPGTTLWTISD